MTDVGKTASGGSVTSDVLLGGVVQAMTEQERAWTLNTVMNQTRELVRQNETSAMLATVTCPCGWARALTKVFKCLYCNVYFCTHCAEQHFGQTIAEYREKHPLLPSVEIEVRDD